MRPSVAPRTLAAAAGIRDTRPSTPVARAKQSSVDFEADSKRAPAATATATPALLEATEAKRLEAEPKAAPDAIETSRPPASVRQGQRELETARFLASAEPAEASRGVTFGSSARVVTLPSLPVLGLLWAITAAVPALIVWSVMRSPAHALTRVAVRSERREPAQSAPKNADAPVVAQAPAEPPAQPADSAGVATGQSSLAAADSAALAASTVPIVVETELADRVSVLIKSKPRSARVYKRAKEIGRTPLIIQIGRGEHRIFEVGLNLGATRRISLDGEKSEIIVTLPEIQPVAPPAPTE